MTPEDAVSNNIVAGDDNESKQTAEPTAESTATQRLEADAGEVRETLVTLRGLLNIC